MTTDNATAAKPARIKRPARGLVSTKPALSDSEREHIMLGANERRKDDMPAPADAAAAVAAPTKKRFAAAPAAAKGAPAPVAPEALPALPAGPWDEVNPDGKDVPFLLRMPPQLHAKMKFLSAHLVPHRARHPLCIAILNQQFDLLIRQYYEKVGGNK